MSENKRLNYTLADGLLVTNYRVKKNVPLAICFVTDFTETERIVIDIEGKRIVSSNIAVSESDLAALIAAIQKG
jgi:hypothetical protein